MDKDLKTAITLVVKELSKKLLVIIGKLSDEKETSKKEYANLIVDCFKLASDINLLIEVREKQDKVKYEVIIPDICSANELVKYLSSWNHNADIELVLRRK
jgi:3-deoxy-D-arabino-heptulosonate 7-phosphate (DAHP) synthase